jgi:hypothetical protein
MKSEIVACAECGCVNAQATDLVARLRADIGNLEADLRGKRARLSEMRAEQSAEAESKPEAELALAILTEWKELCAPYTRELGGKRLETTIARLRGGYTAEQLRQCVQGYARRPYVVGRGTRSPVGSPSQRRIDATLIFRDAKHVDAGIALELELGNHGNGRIPLDAIERVPWRHVQAANRRVIVHSLEREFGGGYDEGNGFTSWPCPRCQNAPSLTLRIAPLGMSYLAECGACGLAEQQLLEAIV